MMRSMFSGVSGLKGHQTRMDVIGNNIANVNTTGFKASRVTFADMISQNLSGASAPQGTIGGVNPKQIGLGMAVASTDLLYTNGSVQSTGKNTDIAISRGDGLFVVSRGNEKYYTRNGAFEFDAQGNLTIPSTGLYVQGYMANNGVISNGGANTTNIQVPAGKSMKATTTTTASFTKNLNATTPGYEVANTLVRYADGTTGTVSSYTPTESGSYVLTTDTGKKIRISDAAAAAVQELDHAPQGVLYTSNITSITASKSGSPAEGNVDLKLDIDTSNPSSPKSIAGAPTVDVEKLETGTYAYGDSYTISGTIKTAQTQAGPPPTVKLTLDTDNNINKGHTVEVVVPNPASFTYKQGDKYTGQLKISKITARGTANDGGATVTTADGNRAQLTSNLTVASATQSYPHTGSAADGKITAITRESTYTYGGKTVSSVTLNTKTGTSVDGLAGKSYAAGDTFYPSFTSLITVYDSLGKSHSVPVVFTKSSNNTWTLSLGTGGDTYNITEEDGTTTTVALSKTDLKFDATGAYVSGSASLNMTYTNGAAAQQLTMNLAALTQYSGTSTAAGTTDGNAAGTLSKVEIDSAGVITGTYTNGVRQKEAQIAMAQFNNPSGLTKMGGNLYQESNNSGTRTISGASDIGTELTTSALEMSNVDIADQFSDMIITQRGFQSNSKIITVSDEMLETLINMKR